jgi:hypothetical protein
MHSDRNKSFQITSASSQEKDGHVESSSASKQTEQEGSGQQVDHSKPGLGRISPTGVIKDIAGTTSRVVYQAASILEEEIAAGIITAKKVEDLLASSNVNSPDQANELVQRFRRDLHEVVDLIMDIINSATSILDQPGISILSNAATSKSNLGGDGKLPTLTLSEPVSAGKVARLSISLKNNVDIPTGEIGFMSTDLISLSGDRISARQVKFTPLRVSFSPFGTEEILITVKIPQGKPVGSYSGLIQSTEVDRLRAVIILEVG